MAVGLMRRQRDRLAFAWRSYWKGPYNLSTITAKFFGDGASSSAGMTVNERTALTYSAFWACVNAISTDVASLPLILYKRGEGGGKTRYTQSRTYQLLHDEPNPEMTSMTMRQVLTAHALTWGGGYAEIERDVLDRPKFLWPLTPDRVTPGRDQADNIVYEVSRSSGPPDIIPAADMLHIPGLGFDGTGGYSVVGMARESVGLGLATERFGATFFGNGATFGGVIAYKGPKPTELSDKNYVDMLKQKHQGVDRAHQLLALYNDATYSRMGIPPNDAQFLETRLHQVEEMCRWFRMPPHKIQHLLRSTNNNIEHQGIEYYTDTLRPWLVRWEQEINRKLISPLERRFQFAEHMIEGVLRGDLKSRYDAYAVGRQWGWLSADDVCDKENMNPLPGGIGKIYLLPLNMVPADRIGEVIDAQIAAKAPPAPAPQPAPNDPSSPSAARALEAILGELLAVQERIEAAVSRAAAADADAVRWKDSAGVFEAEAIRQRADADDLRQKAAVLEALRLEATQRADREVAERAAAIAAAVVDTAGQVEALTTRAVAAETGRAAVSAEIAQLQIMQAEREAALVEARERYNDFVATHVSRTQLEESETQRTALLEEMHRRAQERDEAVEARRQAEQRTDSEAAARATAETALTEQAAAVTALTESARSTSAQIEAFAERLALAEASQAAAHEARRVAEATVVERDAALADVQVRFAQRDAWVPPDSQDAALEALRAELDARTREHDLAVHDLGQARSLVEAHAGSVATATAALAEQQATAQRRMVAVIAAHRGLIADAMGRMIRRETEKARRAQATPEKLRAWIESFYPVHEDIAVTAVLPAIRAHLAWKQSADDPLMVAQAIVRQHIEESQRQLRMVLESDGEDIPQTLESTLRRWESERAEALADTFLREAVDHVSK